METEYNYCPACNLPADSFQHCGSPNCAVRNYGPGDACAARRAAQPADVGATELPPLPEPDGSSSVPIDESKFTFTEVDAWSKPLVLQYAREAIEADRRARANAPVPRWVDDQKGKDPLMDDMIGYIADLRAQLARQSQSSEVGK